MTREEKIAILKDIIDGEIIHSQVRKDVGIWAIRALEQTRWIPVSERLPDENGRYIVFMNTKVFSIRILHFAKNLNEISLDFKSKKAGWYDYDSEYGFFERTEVEAWMPLPQPYKVEKENKK